MSWRRARKGEGADESEHSAATACHGGRAERQRTREQAREVEREQEKKVGLASPRLESATMKARRRRMAPRVEGVLWHGRHVLNAMVPERANPTETLPFLYLYLPIQMMKGQCALTKTVELREHNNFA